MALDAIDRAQLDNIARVASASHASWAFIRDQLRKYGDLQREINQRDHPSVADIERYISEAEAVFAATNGSGGP